MVCEMHHGFGTLLNCYPGGVLAYTGVGKMHQKMVASEGTGRWWYLQHFASSNVLLWGLSICYQVLAQILLSRCLARRFLMLSSTTSHQSKQKRRLLHLQKPQTKMKNMWEKCQLPWNSICKGGSSLYIEKAVCTTLLLARNHPRAIAGKVLYQAGALDLDLLTKAVMMFLSCIGQIVFVCFFFFKKSPFLNSHQWMIWGSPAGAEGSPGPQTFLAMKPNRRGRELCWTWKHGKEP